MGLFSSEPIGYLGVDIGNSGIKIVELKKEGEKARLVSYGFSENNEIVREALWHMDNKKVASLIRATMQKADIKSTSVIASLPAYSVFISIINLVNVDKKVIDQAVAWETKKIIPIPIEDVNLEWRLIESRVENNKEFLKIFVTAVPKLLVQKYRDIFKEAKLSLVSLEPETFALTRSLIGRDKSSFALLELGSTTTDLSIVERGIPVLSRSLDLGGRSFTERLAAQFKMSLIEAEQLKFDLGMHSFQAGESQIGGVMTEAISPIINEIKYLISLYQNRGDKKIEKIILTGGSALLSNLVPYLEKVLDITTVIGDPWSRISYPLELEPLLKEIGPRLAISAGLALNRLE